MVGATRWVALSAPSAYSVVKYRNIPAFVGCPLLCRMRLFRQSIHRRIDAPGASPHLKQYRMVGATRWVALSAPSAYSVVKCRNIPAFVGCPLLGRMRLFRQSIHRRIDAPGVFNYPQQKRNVGATRWVALSAPSAYSVVKSTSNYRRRPRQRAGGDRVRPGDRRDARLRLRAGRSACRSAARPGGRGPL